MLGVDTDNSPEVTSIADQVQTIPTTYILKELIKDDAITNTNFFCPLLRFNGKLLSWKTILKLRVVA